jgi:hypothetical protein
MWKHEHIQVGENTRTAANADCGSQRVAVARPRHTEIECVSYDFRGSECG